MFGAAFLFCENTKHPSCPAVGSEQSNWKKRVFPEFGMKRDIYERSDGLAVDSSTSCTNGDGCCLVGKILYDSLTHLLNQSLLFQFHLLTKKYSRTFLKGRCKI